MLDLMKELLGIDLLDVSKDNILNHFINKAQIAIKNYSNIDIIPDSLNDIVVDLAIYFYRNKNQEGINQATQGSRSQTLESDIPSSIRACLPLPKLKVV